MLLVVLVVGGWCGVVVRGDDGWWVGGVGERVGGEGDRASCGGRGCGGGGRWVGRGVRGWLSTTKDGK